MTEKTSAPSAALAELAVATAKVRQQLDRVPLPSVRQALDDWTAAYLRWAGAVTDELNRQAVNIEAVSVAGQLTDRQVQTQTQALAHFSASLGHLVNEKRAARDGT